MDEWGIDCVVGGSQKGLMLPTGMSFTGVSEKALAAHKTAQLPRFYFDWTMMAQRSTKSFIGTIPVHIFYGLRESIRLIDEEGLDNVHARHARLAEATRRAVRVWAGNDGPTLFCLSPDRYSNSVTAVLMPDGYSGDALRKTIRERFNVSLGGGLGLGGKIFRIGHLGDLNEPMLLGALAAIEMGLRIEGIPHGRGGVEAAMAFLANA
jgi:alanine-glyoxylate transaminase/serine-glyoxylate transaminase/serine-pyruvate transaminase